MKIKSKMNFWQRVRFLCGLPVSVQVLIESGVWSVIGHIVFNKSK